MKQEDFKRMIYQQRMQDYQNNKVINGLAESLSAVFNSLANFAPEYALSALDQLNAQRDNIQKLIDQREEDEEEFLDSVKDQVLSLEVEDE